MRATLTDAPAMMLLSEPRPFEWQRERRIGWGLTDRMQIVGMASLGKKRKRRKRRAAPVAAFSPEAADTTAAAPTPANAAALVAAEAPVIQDAATALVPVNRSADYSGGPDIYDPAADAADEAYEGQAGLYALACRRRRRAYGRAGMNGGEGVGFLPLIAAGASLVSSLFSKKPKPPAPAPAPAPAPVAAAPQASNKFPVSLPLLAAGALAVYLLARKA